MICLPYETFNYELFSHDPFRSVSSRTQEGKKHLIAEHSFARALADAIHIVGKPSH